MPASHSYAATAVPSSLSEDGDDLLQPLRRIDRAHQLLTDLDNPSSIHIETNESSVPGLSSALAKESPIVSHTAKLSPQPEAPSLQSPATLAITPSDELLDDSWPPEDLLQWQAADLIAFLQHWSDDLDQRAAKLHADIAAQERRERTFRLWMQQQLAAIETQASEEATRHATQTAQARRAFFAATEAGL